MLNGCALTLPLGRPAQVLAAPTGLVRVVRRQPGLHKGARCRASQEGETQHPKQSIASLAAQQNSGTDPDGALGGLDPGRREGGPASGPRELDIDAELKRALRPLLQHARAGLSRHHGDMSPHGVASAALAAAEASGALPPLAGPQRATVEGFFARLAAEELRAGWGEAEGAGTFGATASSGGGEEQPDGEEDPVLKIRPMQRELLEAVINAHLASGGASRCSCSPADSAKAGGEVGNLALQSDTHGSAEPRGNPAQSETDRAERQAEGMFEQLELGDLPHADAADFDRQREWASHWENKAASAAIEGDAPAAGDGLQAVQSPLEADHGGGIADADSSFEAADNE